MFDGIIVCRPKKSDPFLICVTIIIIIYTSLG